MSSFHCRREAAVVVDHKTSTSLDIFCGDVSITQNTHNKQSRNQTKNIHSFITVQTIYMYVINYCWLVVHVLVCLLFCSWTCIQCSPCCHPWSKAASAHLAGRLKSLWVGLVVCECWRSRFQLAAPGECCVTVLEPRTRPEWVACDDETVSMIISLSRSSSWLLLFSVVHYCILVHVRKSILELWSFSYDLYVLYSFPATRHNTYHNSKLVWMLGKEVQCMYLLVHVYYVCMYMYLLATSHSNTCASIELNKSTIKLPSITEADCFLFFFWKGLQFQCIACLVY